MNDLEWVWVGLGSDKLCRIEMRGTSHIAIEYDNISVCALERLTRNTPEVSHQRMKDIPLASMNCRLY